MTVKNITMVNLAIDAIAKQFFDQPMNLIVYNSFALTNESGEDCSFL
jgi:hypothetical protein